MKEEGAMAFEAFMRGSRGRWSRRRRVTVVISVALHAALLVVGATHSVWSVEELESPPMVIIRPPPPPTVAPVKVSLNEPPNPPSGPDRNRGGIRSPDRPQPKAPPPVTPIATRPPGLASDSDEPETGYDTKPGIGTGPDTPGPHDERNDVPPGGVKSLPTEIARHQVLHGPLPHLPPALKQLGAEHQVTLRVCVSTVGTVVSTTPIRATLAAVSETVAETVRTWRYKPYAINGRPVPFCYQASFNFRVE
jgi:protein TonB